MPILYGFCVSNLVTEYGCILVHFDGIGFIKIQTTRTQRQNFILNIRMLMIIECGLVHGP